LTPIHDLLKNLFILFIRCSKSAVAFCNQFRFAGIYFYQNRFLSPNDSIDLLFSKLFYFFFNLLKRFCFCNSDLPGFINGRLSFFFDGCFFLIEQVLLFSVLASAFLIASSALPFFLSSYPFRNRL
jgi:hypothetical protein